MNLNFLFVLEKCLNKLEFPFLDGNTKSITVLSSNLSLEVKNKPEISLVSQIHGET